MKKNNKRQQYKKSDKLEVYLDFTDPNKPISQVIEENKEQLNQILSSFNETKTDISEVLKDEEIKVSATKPTKKIKWYRRMWNAICSMF